MTVSGGTYVRSIVHDIGIALGSSAHVVKLTRTRQGNFFLDPPESPLAAEDPDPDGVEKDGADPVRGCVRWETLADAMAAKKEKAADRAGHDGAASDTPEWEREILANFESLQ